MTRWPAASAAPERPASLPASRPRQPLAARPGPRARPVLRRGPHQRDRRPRRRRRRRLRPQGNPPHLGQRRTSPRDPDPPTATRCTHRLTRRAARMARRPDPGAVLNQRGQRLSAKGAHDVITGLAPAAGLDDDATTHVLRHTSRRRSSAAGPTSSSSPSCSGTPAWKPPAATPARAQKTAHALSTSFSSTSSAIEAAQRRLTDFSALSWLYPTRIEKKISHIRPRSRDRLNERPVDAAGLTLLVGWCRLP